MIMIPYLHLHSGNAAFTWHNGTWVELCMVAWLDLVYMAVRCHPFDISICSQLNKAVAKHNLPLATATGNNLCYERTKCQGVSSSLNVIRAFFQRVSLDMLYHTRPLAFLISACHHS